MRNGTTEAPCQGTGWEDPAQPTHPSPTLTGLGAVTTGSTIVYDPCRSRLLLGHFSRQSSKRGTTPGVVHPDQPEGTADPLASVLATSRLMSVVQEFRNEKNETGSRISVLQLTDDCGPPVWSALSGRGSEASLRARLLSRGYARGICPRAEAEGIRPSGTHCTEALPFLRLPRGPGSGHGA